MNDYNDHDSNDMTYSNIDIPDPRFNHGVPNEHNSITDTIMRWSRYTSPYISEKINDVLTSDEMNEFHTNSDMSIPSDNLIDTPQVSSVTIQDINDEASESNQKDGTNNEESPASALERLLKKMEAIYQQSNDLEYTGEHSTTEKMSDHQVNDENDFPYRPDSAIVNSAPLHESPTADADDVTHAELATDSQLDVKVALDLEADTNSVSDAVASPNVIEENPIDLEEDHSDISISEIPEEVKDEEPDEVSATTEKTQEPVEDTKQEQLFISDHAQNLERQEALRKQISATPSLREAEKLLELMEKQPRMSTGGTLQSPEDTSQIQPDIPEKDEVE